MRLGRGITEAERKSDFGAAATMAGNFKAPFLRTSATLHGNDGVSVKDNVSTTLKVGRSARYSFAGNRSISSNAEACGHAEYSASAQLLAQLRMLVRRDCEDRRLLVPALTFSHTWSYFMAIMFANIMWGWNIALPTIGWPSFTLATIISAILFFCLSVTVAQMVMAIPLNGGVPTLCSMTYGETYSTFVCLTITISYALLVAHNVLALSTYIYEYANIPSKLSVTIWLALYMLIYGISQNSRVLFASIRIIAAYTIYIIVCMMLICVSSTLLPFNTVAAATNLGAGRAAEVYSSPAPSVHLIMEALPYSLWWFLGLEAVQLASEEMQHLRSVVLPVSMAAYSTMAFFVLLCLIVSPMLAYSLDALESSPNPIVDIALDLIQVSPDTTIGRVVTVICMFGPLFGATLCGVYATSRKIHSLSRLGLIPRQLSVTREGTPIFAIMCTIALCFTVTLILYMVKLVVNTFSLNISDKEIEDLINGILIKLPAWTCAVAYACLSLTYVTARLRFPFLFRGFQDKNKDKVPLPKCPSALGDPPESKPLQQIALIPENVDQTDFQAKVKSNISLGKPHGFPTSVSDTMPRSQGLATQDLSNDDSRSGLGVPLDRKSLSHSLSHVTIESGMSPDASGILKGKEAFLTAPPGVSTHLIPTSQTQSRQVLASSELYNEAPAFTRAPEVGMHRTSSSDFPNAIELPFYEPDLEPTFTAKKKPKPGRPNHGRGKPGNPSTAITAAMQEAIDRHNSTLSGRIQRWIKDLCLEENDALKLASGVICLLGNSMFLIGMLAGDPGFYVYFVALFAAIALAVVAFHTFAGHDTTHAGLISPCNLYVQEKLLANGVSIAGPESENLKTAITSRLRTSAAAKGAPRE